jgi:YesN/AraC family two-component response regulator
MTMPNMTGDQLAKELLAVNPDIPIIILTGFSERINKHTIETLGIKGLLMKPVVTSDMALEIRRVLDESQNVVQELS